MKDFKEGYFLLGCHRDHVVGRPKHVPKKQLSFEDPYAEWLMQAERTPELMARIVWWASALSETLIKAEDEGRVLWSKPKALPYGDLIMNLLEKEFGRDSFNADCVQRLNKAGHNQPLLMKVLENKLEVVL